MKKVNIKLTVAEGATIPTKATSGADAYDLYAFIAGYNPELGEGHERTETGVVLHPGGRVLIPTGLKMEIPVGYRVSVKPRSGLALKQGITCLNSPGTIDSDYRGDVGVILVNHSNRDFNVGPNDRIAQMSIEESLEADFEVADLSETDRGEGGFGSTGVNKTE